MKNVIGIDIGGTKISGVLFDGKKVLKELRIVTPKTTADFSYSLKHLVAFLSVGQKISGIGIGMAGVINIKTKTAVYSPNIKYIKNFNFKKLFGSGISLKVANDAKCFALAEARLGQGKSHNSLVGLILGTGVGSGLVLSGKIYPGANFGAGEVGHLLYNGRDTFEKVFQIARDANNNKQLSEITGNILLSLYRILDPEIIVLGGGVAMDSKREFIEQAKSICGKALSSYGIKPKIIVSKLKNAGAIGAALLVK